tara:strand:+ start:128 stop:769 length:642 start_codon:yes stop_codon:yes gene_type:complete
MGNRRLGARRLNALLGQKLAEDNTNRAGAGSDSFVVSNIVSRRGSEVVTEITVDLGSSKGAAFMSGDAGEVIAFSSSGGGGAAEAQTGGAAYLAQLTPAVNGYIYGAEMICTELPLPSAAQDIDLKAGTTATTQFSGTVAGSPKTLIDIETTWALGAYEASGSFALEGAFLDTGLDNYYLYLTKGSATDSLKHEYTAGKYTIRLLGVLATEDK